MRVVDSQLISPEIKHKFQVVKQNFSHDMADLLMADLLHSIELLGISQTTNHTEIRLSNINLEIVQPEAVRRDHKNSVAKDRWSEVLALALGHNLKHRKNSRTTYGVC